MMLRAINFALSGTLLAYGLHGLCADATSPIVKPSASKPAAPPGHCKDAISLIDVTPATKSLTAAGATYTVTARVYNSCTMLSVASGTVAWGTNASGVATVAATTSRKATVTAVANGTAIITGTYGTVSDNSVVTVSISGGGVVTLNGCPQSGYLRLVNVSTVSQLTSANSASLPGDQIRLAPGTYTLASDLVTTRAGTQTNPITLCGPRTAIIAAKPIQPHTNWWVFKGFQHDGQGSALWNFYFDPGSFNVLDSLELHNSFQESTHLHGSSKHNELKNLYIHDTGDGRPSNGEGIYFGSGATGTDRADSNWAHDNTLVNVTQECFDVKEGTTRNILSNNSMTNCGSFMSIGSDAGIVLRGDSAHTYGNRITTTPRYAEQVWPDCGGTNGVSSTCPTQGKGNIIQKDTMSGMGNGVGVQLRAGNATTFSKVCTDNVMLSGTIGVTTVSCGAFTPGMP